MAEDKSKVNVKEDGTPMKFGDEGYLIAGKYKTLEEAESGIKAGEQKITELGQGKSGAEKARDLLQDTIKKAGQKDVDAEQAEKDGVRKARADSLKVAWDKGPEAAVDELDKIIQDGIASGGVLKKEDYDKGVSDDRNLMSSFTKVRGTGNRKREFDMLKPEMGQIWNALPKEARTPEMVENVFFMARGKANPEDLKAKLLESLKAGAAQTPGSRSDDDLRTENDKIVDGVVEQAKKDKIF